MDLPVEMQWHQLEYITDVKTIANVLFVCKLWYSIMGELNNKYRQMVKANMHKHTHEILSLRHNSLSRLRFGVKCKEDKHMRIRSKLQETISIYIKSVIGKYPAVSPVTTYGSKLRINMCGDVYRRGCEVFIRREGSVLVEFWASKNMYKICDAGFRTNKLMVYGAQSEGRIKDMEILLVMFKGIWLQYYSDKSLIISYA